MPATATERARVFFALWPGEQVRTRIVEATARPLAGLPGRPVPAANLHLTLAFLHSVEQTRLPVLAEVAEALVLPPMTLVLDRWGFFAGPRVLWLGPEAIPESLGAFEQRLWEALAPLGFRREHGRFHPHVTVRRKAVSAPAKPPEPVSWPVTDWALVQSRPGQIGSMYTPLAQWPVRH